MKVKDKIAIIGTNGLPAKYGGFETLANYLTLYLKEDYDFVVYCSKTPKEDQLKTFNSAKLIYFPFKANGWQSVISDIITIIHAWFTVDKLLVLGNSGALIFPFKYIFGKKLILNIGGLDWRREKWNYIVKKYIKLSEIICVKYSDVVITDNKHIQYLYKKYYNTESEMIEYGGDHVLKLEKTKEAVIKYPFLNKKYILSISRAQSDNNIHMLLKAFENLPEYNLVLISNWNNSDYGKELYERYKNKFENILIVDAIYDQKKLDIIRTNASLYIHSHSFCGTAPSLVEAMNLELPIICYNAKTNLETTENKSYYFENEHELVALINKLTYHKLNRLKKDMYSIAKRRYQWALIAQKYKNCIEN